MSNSSSQSSISSGFRQWIRKSYRFAPFNSIQMTKLFSLYQYKIMLYFYTSDSWILEDHSDYLEIVIIIIILKFFASCMETCQLQWKSRWEANQQAIDQLIKLTLIVYSSTLLCYKKQKQNKKKKKEAPCWRQIKWLIFGKFFQKRCLGKVIGRCEHISDMRSALLSIKLRNMKSNLSQL